jgi:hypothetical protein
LRVGSLFFQYGPNAMNLSLNCFSATGSVWTNVAAGYSGIIAFDGATNGWIFYSQTAAAGAAFTPVGWFQTGPNGTLVSSPLAANAGLSVVGAAGVTGALTVTGDVNVNGINYGGLNAIALLWASPYINLSVDATPVGSLIYSLTGGGVTPIYAISANGPAGLLAASFPGGQATWSAVFSDRRLKTDIAEPDRDALAVVGALAVHRFDLTNPFPGATPQHWDFGLIADEVESVLPAAFIPPFGESGHQSLRELPIIAALVKAVQQLLARVEALEAVP